MNKDKFIQDWLEGNITPEEMTARRQDPAYQSVIEELEGVMDVTSDLKVPERRSKAQAWDELLTKMEEDETPTQPQGKVVSFKRYLPVSIAAAVALLLAVYFLLPGNIQVQTGRGEQLTHLLPDGSTAVLNAETILSYQASNWENARTLKLEGEAFFDVKPGNTFVITGSHGSVEVLGTSFNTYSRPDRLEVSCFEGSIKVKSLKDEAVTLDPGEFTVAKGSAPDPPRPFEQNKTATWRKGEFYFDQVPFEDVIEELQRQFDVTVSMEIETPRRYTGYFNNEDLDEALKLVFLPMSLEYEKQGDLVIVK